MTSDEEPIIVVTGNPVDGFTFYGPLFANTPEVEDFTDSLDGDWWYAPLIATDSTVIWCAVPIGPEMSPAGLRVNERDWPVTLAEPV